MMVESPRGRVLILVLLVVAYLPAMLPELAGRSNPPIYENYEAYVGEQVTDLNGRVVATDPVEIAVGGDRLRLTVENVETPVEIGDKIRIYGDVQPGHTVHAKNVITAAPSTDQWRIYLLSFFAGLWVLTRILRDWAVDWKRWGLMPAETRGDES